MRLDCGSRVSDHWQPGCERQSNEGVGILVIGIAVFLVVTSVGWLYLKKRYAKDDRPTHTEL